MLKSFVEICFVHKLFVKIKKFTASAKVNQLCFDEFRFRHSFLLRFFRFWEKVQEIRELKEQVL